MKAELRPDYYQSFYEIPTLETPEEKDYVTMILNYLTKHFTADPYLFFHFTMMLFTSLYAFYLVMRPLGLPRNGQVNW